LCDDNAAKVVCQFGGLECWIRHQPTLVASRFAALHRDQSWCPNCGGQLKIIAAILDAPVIELNLTHLGLHALAPPRVAARGDRQQAG